jgi:glutamyl-tRNA synthetase
MKISWFFLLVLALVFVAALPFLLVFYLLIGDLQQFGGEQLLQWIEAWPWLFFGGQMLYSLIIAFVISRILGRPLRQLEASARKMAQGEWGSAIGSERVFGFKVRELDSLAQSVEQVEGSAEHLIQSLQTLGLYYDEGPDIGGQFAPYRQSERLAIYKEWAQKLIDAGRAYADPYSPEEVQTFRGQAQKVKRPFLYRNHRPENPPAWDGTQPLRFKSEPKSYEWHDAVMGDLKTGPEVIDDFILIKSDGYPTYNFCHIVDDAEMEITHVIRGQEFISSVPNYLNLYEALDITPPVMATMPHILNEQGNKKLGKRDGAKDVLDYVREGFLPDALVSFIATLGWNDGTEQEIFTRDELIGKFSLDRVGKSGAHFDERRLLWTIRLKQSPLNRFRYT